MFRRLVTALLLSIGLVLIGTPTFAAPPTTETTTVKNGTETFVDVAPTCAGGGPIEEG
jgi:hypothetical protein